MSAEYQKWMKIGQELGFESNELGEFVKERQAENRKQVTQHSEEFSLHSCSKRCHDYSSTDFSSTDFSSTDISSTKRFDIITFKWKLD
jgi:hypothetical protein